MSGILRDLRDALDALARLPADITFAVAVLALITRGVVDFIARRLWRRYAARLRSRRGSDEREVTREQERGDG